MGDSLASQLATQRDGVASLTGEGEGMAAGASCRVAAKQPGGCDWFIGGRPDSCSLDVVPSPRVDPQEVVGHSCHRQAGHREGVGTIEDYLAGGWSSPTPKILESLKV